MFFFFEDFLNEFFFLFFSFEQKRYRSLVLPIFLSCSIILFSFFFSLFLSLFSLFFPLFVLFFLFHPLPFPAYKIWSLPTSGACRIADILQACSFHKILCLFVRECACPSYCGPHQPRIQTEVLGHLLVRSLVCSHRSLVHLLRTTRFARALYCANSLTRGTVND